MKKLLLLSILLIVGCSSPIVGIITDIFISPRVYSNYSECSDYINRYNDLQNEKKQLDVEYEKVLENDSLSDEQKQEYEDRILDLSFQVNNALQDLEYCKSRQITNPL